MPAWIYVLAVAAVLFVAWYGFARRWWHSLRYSWQQARHLADLTETELIPGAEYGSMNLDDDPNGPAITELLRQYDPGGDDWPVQPPLPRRVTWRERTARELSPEALNREPWPEFGADLAERYDPDPIDPGPGDAAGSSSPASPGPDHIHNGSCSDDRCWDGRPGRNADWLEAQMADLFAWVRTMHESRVTA